MSQLFKLVIVLLVVSGLTACSDATRPDGGGADVVEGGSGGAGSGAEANGAGGSEDFGASASGTGAASDFKGHPLDNPQGPLSQRVFYFDYDSSDVRPEDRTNLNKHAEYLASNPDTKVTVEGHADERGTREYNIALSERRAQSVRRLLLFQGAAFDQVEVVSFGEERPVAFGHDESSWQQNRRVELNYEGH